MEKKQPKLTGLPANYTLNTKKLVSKTICQVLEHFIEDFVEKNPLFIKKKTEYLDEAIQAGIEQRWLIFKKANQYLCCSEIQITAYNYVKSLLGQGWVREYMIARPSSYRHLVASLHYIKMQLKRLYVVDEDSWISDADGAASFEYIVYKLLEKQLRKRLLAKLLTCEMTAKVEKVAKERQREESWHTQRLMES